MNQFYYSPSTKGFYEESIHGSNMPEDVVSVTDEQRLDLLARERDGQIIDFDKDAKIPVTIDKPELPLTKEQLIAKFTAEIQARLDNFARTRNYDNCQSCVTYAGSVVAKFATEAAYMISRRDAYWQAAYQILADVDAGIRAIPTKEDLFSELGPLEWPN